MPFTESYANTVLAMAFPATTEIGLLDDNDSEISVTGYKRAAIGKLNSNIAGQVANDETIFMFECTGGSATATQFALYNGGSMVFIGDLVKSLTISDGYVPLIRSHQLVIGLDKDVLEGY